MVYTKSMSPRIIQDVVPAQRKSIRDIPLPPSRNRNREREKVAEEKEREEEIEEEKREEDEAVRAVREEFEHRHHHRGGGSKSKKYFIIGGIIAAVIIVFFVVNSLAHAKVKVVLSSQSLSVSGSFVTRPISAASSTNGITASVITVTKTGSATVTASGTQDVETKAAGTIIIFNDYSTSPQKLVVNTRFQTPSGLIYRINQSVTVPGKTTKGKVTTPGSVTVGVTADQVGDKYNIDLSDFTIPGFAGEPQFDGFFGRSKTPMTGGFSGTKPVVASADRSNAESTIRANLAKQVVASALSSVPAGYILYPNAYRIDYASLPDSGSGTQVGINEQATLTGFALNENDIDTALAGNALTKYDGSPITISNVGSLALSASNVPATASSTMSFTLAGTAKFVWSIDAAAFSAQLAGKPKADFTTILQGYPHVDKASVSFFPFWAGSFPKNPADIAIATSTAI